MTLDYAIGIGFYYIKKKKRTEKEKEHEQREKGERKNEFLVSYITLYWK